jgi:hypothetical protein
LYYLGAAYRTLFEHSGSTDNLSNAIAAARQSLMTLTTDSVMFLRSLRNALRLNFESMGSLNYLEESVALYEQTIKLLPSDHPSRLGCLIDFGLALQ